MKPSNCLALLCIVLIFSVTGCVAGLQTQSSPTDVETATSGVVLTLKTSKSTYVL